MLEPPADLSKAEAAVWRREAPRAIARGTLIEATASGFVELCELLAMKAELKTKMRKKRGGVAGAAAEGTLRQFVRIGQRVDQLLARFRLTSFGKVDESAPPAPGEQPKGEINPWSAVG